MDSGEERSPEGASAENPYKDWEAGQEDHCLLRGMERKTMDYGSDNHTCDHAADQGHSRYHSGREYWTFYIYRMRFNLRQPPARLFAIICLNMAARARWLTPAIRLALSG